jgi:hypothetical protein
MKYPTVSALCEGVAGAIRAKEGSTALINPQDFVDRINALSIGGGGEEYGVYLKILDVPAKIDGGKDSTLNVDSPEVVEFFSDAFEWGKVVNNEDELDAYYKNSLPDYFAVVAYEAKKKEMGLPNVYDTLQKRVPILAVKTKSSYDDVEKLVVINDITREEDGELIGSNSSFSVNFDTSEDSIYGMWKLTVQFRKDGIFIASID